MRSKVSLLILALMTCGAANAAETAAETVIGDVATVQAPLAFGAQNTINATWTQDPSVSGTSVTAMQKLGTLNIQLTGSHAGVYVTGDGTGVSGGIVTIPFRNAAGVNYLRGRTDANISQQRSTPIVGHNGPGWKLVNTGDNINLDIKAFQKGGNIPAGTYTATFYIQQYQN
ncbi:fimbrial protein SefA [Escherichia coli]|nr:fimbrial protein SefA [Escherichia coli]ELT8672647.1 CD15/CS22/SEF14 family fimbrial major subunit [Escherichia coli]